jgi:methylmalonyl-CoA/ethylmalonyl-CoA epimerase
MIRRIDHVGIAVRALSERLPFWCEALGLPLQEIETVASEDVRVAFLPVGASRIELLEATSDDSPIARAIGSRGEGIHHLTLAVDDLAATLGRLAEHGIVPLGDGIRSGAGGHRIAFLHPRAAGGVLLELVESTPEPGPGPDLVPGVPVLAYLREPSEKLWGVLRRLDPAGVTIEGVDLGSFDDWVAQVEREEEPVVGPSILFVPMTRVEKVLLDRSSGNLPSLAERFERRTGRRVQDVLDADRRRDGSAG